MACDRVVLEATRREERPVRSAVRPGALAEERSRSSAGVSIFGFTLGILDFAAPDPCRTSWDWLASLLGVPSC